MAAAEQLFLITAVGASTQQPLQMCITLLFSHLNTTVVDNTPNSNEYFMLLCRLLNYAMITNSAIPEAKKLLEEEIAWLTSVQCSRGSLDPVVDDAVLEGHLGLARELVGFCTPEEKFDLGSNEAKGICLIKSLVEDFIFPASKQMVVLVKTRELSLEPLTAICNSPPTLNAAFQLLVALCTECAPNMKLLVHMLTDMFYSERDKPLVEWDYLPPLGPRPPRGFVGLKNAGATCYMNSVLQQLFMVESIRTGLLAADGAATDLNEDFSGEAEGSELESVDSEPAEDRSESRKEYNIGILKHVQLIFGHLACSQLQFYIPHGLWRHFKLQGEPVNLREQQDAVEFFMSLVESLDEALKALGQEQIMSKILGGSYSDQKICKGCPHRYAKEEPFSVISVDIRNHSTLLDSLEQYVKGELLEGADAYHCDKCNKKVVTVKRLCVKKLPPVLAIQLKRFEYDFDRVCAIKFNDYFEFPRHLDMDPYTVSGLAKLEGELVDCDPEELSKNSCTKYQLSGIVVHSGQASGGHYYSFILHRLVDGTCKWYKFDDGEVSEWKMEDQEEMKSQCFGGDYMGEVFDQVLKRTSFRRQKRWWNAYMLYYTRLDAIKTSDSRLPVKMPPSIERGVRRQNIVFMHNRNQFSPEYFQFIRKLVSCNSPSALKHQNDQLSPDAEELSQLSVQLASSFLFHTGFHTKKTLRGSALDWYDVVTQHLRHFPAVRKWFSVQVLFQHPHRLSEYLLSSPTAEVRAAFMKILVFLAHFTLQDGPCTFPAFNTRTVICDPNATLSDHLLHALLLLLDKEMADHGRYLVNFFSLFQNYAALGMQERAQLLKLNVVETFMMVAQDEGPGPTVKYQYPEWTKLHQVVSLLVRCCDVSSKCHNSQPGQPPLPNPFAECPEYIMPVQLGVADHLFVKTGYIKKVMEDPSPSEESIKLIQFASWENPRFSRDILSECLWQISYAYCQDIKHHFDLLLHLLLMEDSWQSHRIHNALQGVAGGGASEQKEGLLDIIARSKNHYQKRAYQCIKCLTALFSRCHAAGVLLSNSEEIRVKWVSSVEWLQDELERRPYGGGNQYTYSNWSPPTQSNDAANGYFLERSNSARKLLERALELCPQEEVEAEVEEGGEEEKVGGDNPPPTHLVNINQSYQQPEGSVVLNQSLDTNVESHQDHENTEADVDKGSMPACESALANLILEQK